MGCLYNKDSDHKQRIYKPEEPIVSSEETNGEKSKTVDPSRAWDQKFEKWKNHGFPLDNPSIPIPPPHPDSKNHKWDDTLEGKKAYLKLRNLNPDVLNEDYEEQAEQGF